MAKRRSGLAEVEIKKEETSPEKSASKSKRSPRRTLWLIVGILVAFVIYAFAFETTEVSLAKIRDERRQEQLFRVLRALARPDLLTYESADTATELDYMVPCPTDGFEPASIKGNANVSVDPICADPRTEVIVTGSGFKGNSPVQVFFVPPSGVELRLVKLRTSSEGTFEEQVRIPNRPDSQVQTIRVVSELSIGSIFSPVMVETEEGDVVRSPRWSENAKNTLDGIIETVFLALLATTAGTLIAIPLSFFAARNLMRDVRVPAIQLGLAVVAIPLGVAFGLLAFNTSSAMIEGLPDSVLLNAVATIIFSWVGVLLIRLSVPAPGSQSSRLLPVLAAIGSGLAVLFAGQTLARFADLGGTWFADTFQSLSILGNFVATMGDILSTAFGVLTAIVGGAIFGLLGSKAGYGIGRRVSTSVQTILTVLVMALAGGIVALGLGQIVGWLYQIEDPRATVAIPFVVGTVIGGLGAWRGLVKGHLGAGISVYYGVRTVSNTLRSIEPLVMALVFVIWVGLGPFAGSLALGLHTIAALTKLYSEQVESIAEGPMEAVRATGATRLQTVVYGVVPQIVAPYIAFTMYRWDINVRLSTIIGFVGGGGIGFLLQQNIGLLNYRAAAAQMLAIAIVVASMDYISSRLRERFT